MAIRKHVVQQNVEALVHSRINQFSCAKIRTKKAGCGMFDFISVQSFKATLLVDRLFTIGALILGSSNSNQINAVPPTHSVQVDTASPTLKLHLALALIHIVIENLDFAPTRSVGLKQFHLAVHHAGGNAPVVQLFAPVSGSAVNQIADVGCHRLRGRHAPVSV